MKNLKLKFESLRMNVLTPNELRNTNGGGEIHHGSNSTGTYIWWYNEDGTREGYYTSYFA